MGGYILRRLLSMVPVLLLVSVFVFSLILFMPGDPARVMLGDNAAPEMVQALRAELGLDQPVPVQYIQWLGKAVRGDLGTSLRNRQPVGAAVIQRVTVTVHIALTAVVIALVTAIPLGIIAAMRRNSLVDKLCTGLAVVGMGIPHFWLGMMLILAFGVWLHWLPISGYVSPLDNPLESVRRTILPGLTLSTILGAMLMRQVRSSMIEVLEEEYICTARAKGLRESQVLIVHAFRNVLIPVITVVGLQTGRLFGGSVITEFIFSVPGMGRLAVESIFGRGFPTLQGVVLAMALAVLVSNLIVDVLYAYVDPRVRYN